MGNRYCLKFVYINDRSFEGASEGGREGGKVRVLCAFQMGKNKRI